MKHHVSREFSDWDHIWCFLQLDGLLIYESRSIMQDDKWVERAILCLPLGWKTAASTESSLVFKDLRRAPPWQSCLLPTERTRNFDGNRYAACSTLYNGARSHATTIDWR